MDYPKPSLTVDGVLIDCKWNILLIKRLNDPFKDHWALPGGFVNEGEDVELAAQREVFEETNVTVIFDRIVGAYGKKGRDPRGWVVSIAYAAHYVRFEKYDIKAKDDAKQIIIVPYKEILAGNVPLAFDHLEIVTDAMRSTEY